jgi:Holliday junction DNA helicase RuvA
MIAFLSGVLADKTLDSVVIDVGGVGYLLHVSTQTLAELPSAGQPIRLLCHTHVREDALQLFGFAEPLEREAFELLIAVSGVGPRLALTILSGMDVRSLTAAISAGDHKRLQGIPGVGKKTAERLVVELRERFAKLTAEVGHADGRPNSELAEEEVVLALVNLGYRRPLAERAVEWVRQQQTDTAERQGPEQTLRAALGVIAEL